MNSTIINFTRLGAKDKKKIKNMTCCVNMILDLDPHQVNLIRESPKGERWCCSAGIFLA